MMARECVKEIVRFKNMAGKISMKVRGTITYSYSKESEGTTARTKSVKMEIVIVIIAFRSVGFKNSFQSTSSP
jgi:hypothetical protein